MLSASGTAKHSFFEFGKMHLEKIPLVAAAVQASSPFRVADQLKLGLLQLEGVAKGFGFQLAGVEQAEFELIRYPERGTCLYRCGNERYLLQVHFPEFKEKMFGKAGGR